MPRGSVSRVLSFKAIICLRSALPQSFSHPSEYRRANDGTKFLPLSVLLRIGFAGPCGSPHAGELLPRLSTLTCISKRYISVALSLRSPSAAVSRYPALWSSDFPHAAMLPATARFTQHTLRIILNHLSQNVKQFKIYYKNIYIYAIVYFNFLR